MRSSIVIAAQRVSAFELATARLLATSWPPVTICFPTGRVIAAMSADQNQIAFFLSPQESLIYNEVWRGQDAVRFLAKEIKLTRAALKSFVKKREKAKFALKQARKARRLLRKRLYARSRAASKKRVARAPGSMPSPTVIDGSSSSSSSSPSPAKAKREPWG